MTADGTLDVPEAVYQTMTKSDVLSVHRAAHIDTVFAVEQKQTNTLFYLD